MISEAILTQGRRLQRTIHVTEATSFTFLRMMQATGPVDSDITLVAIQARCALHATTSTNSAEFEETVEHGTVVTHIVPTLFLRELVHIVRSDFRKEINVLVGMELGHFVFRCRFRTLAISRISTIPRHSNERKGRNTHIDLHLLVEAIVHDQAVGHAYTVWLHRVTGDVGIVTHVGVVEVSHLLVVGDNAIGERFGRHFER